MKSISHSRVSSYLTCRRQNYYGYILNLTKKSEGDALYYGKASHEVLDAFYKVWVGIDSTSSKGVLAATWGAAIEAASAKMLELEEGGYVDPPNKRPLRELLFAWYFPNEPFVRHGYTILASEAAYNLKIDDELSYLFVVDLIVKDRVGKIAVVDHKNVYNFITSDESELMPQIPKYIGALRALGTFYPDYGIYNQLRTRPIKEPQLKQMVQTMEIRPSDLRIQRTFVEQIDVSLEVDAIDGMDPEEQDAASWRATNQMTCRMCAFKTLCAAQLEGDDWEHIRDKFYRERDQRDGIPLTDDDIED